MSASREHEPHFVYRLYNRDRRLLYVGCTYDVRKRLGLHLNRTPWYPEVATHKVEGPFATRTEALAREQEVIRREAPRYNQPAPVSRLYTVAQVAELLACSQPFVLRLIGNGDIPARIRDDELERFIDARTQPVPRRLSVAQSP